MFEKDDKLNLNPDLAELEIEGLDVALLEIESFEFNAETQPDNTDLDSLTTGHGMTEIGGSVFPIGCCSCCLPCCCCCIG